MATKKNLRSIPRPILDKLTKLAVDDVVVACAKRLTPNDVPNYAHIGLRIENGRIVLPAPAVPPARMGKYSDTNVNGREVVRRDLPMVTKTFSMEAPDWNGYGTHTVWHTRDVYVRDFIAPKELTLSVDLLKEAPDGSAFTIKFAVDEVLSRAAPDFESELLYNLNILQENVGAVDVFASQATLAEYAVTIRLDWEILPVGNIDETLRLILNGKRPVSAQQTQVMRQRLEAMSRLNPQNYIAGTSEFLRYFGAKFEDDFVAFENLNYGNALYVMYEDWERLCRLSRVDLLKGRRDGFERIPHTGDWAGKLRALLDEHRRDRMARRP